MKHEDIAALAHLARININDDMVDDVTSTINNIFTLVDQLQQADTDGVTPMSHPLDAEQRLRADEITETNQRNKLQANAPAVDNGLFLVPKVID